MTKITFAQITATNCELTKTFKRGTDGRIESTAIAHMTEGSARVVEIPDVSFLSHVFEVLTPHEAITCGVPVAGNTPLTTRAGAEFRRDAVARTNEAFSFPYGPALFPIDVDVDGDNFTSVGAVLDALEACSPWMRNAHRVARPSSSSYVAGRGLRGVHVYLAVTRGTDVPALAKRMQIEQWAAGRGFVKISKSGALLVRQLSDALVYQPSRLMFEAAPVTQGDVARDVPHGEHFIERAPQVVGAPAKYRIEGMIDVAALGALRDIEERRFVSAVRDAKNRRRREAKTIAIDYQKANAIAQGLDPEQGERYGLLATRALGDKALPRSWVINVKDVGRQTVEQIVAALPDSLGFQCADPFDTWRPDLEPKHFGKAEIVMMGDTPGIWSHKLQEFFAFTSADAADLSSPLDLAAERLCGLVEYPEKAGKAAPFVNVKFGLELLLREIDARPRLNACTNTVESADVPPVGRLADALSRIGCNNVTPGTIDKALEAIALEHTYDPWKTVILSLPAWDGVPRLDTVFEDTFGAAPSLAQTYASRALFAALVMRQLRPGAPAPVVPVIIGAQGIGKSRFVADIARALGVPLPSSIAFSDDRRMSMAASRSVIAELAEMSGMGRRDMDDIKRWSEDAVDAYRRPYEKQEEAHPRRFVLVGTANKHELNRDDTGNRRFMPIMATRPCAPNWSVEVLQILAEAKKQYCEDEARYYAMCQAASDAVREHNRVAMLNGEGVPLHELDDLLPAILQTMMRHSGGRRVYSGPILTALEASNAGRRVRANEVARWLCSRGWSRGQDSKGRFYDAPQEYVDEGQRLTVVSPSNPFTDSEAAA
jgi:hypothetical protein